MPLCLNHRYCDSSKSLNCRTTMLRHHFTSAARLTHSFCQILHPPASASASARLNLYIFMLMPASDASLCRFCARLVLLLFSIFHFCTVVVFSVILPGDPICEVHLATNWWHHLTPGSPIFAPKLHFLATLPQPYFFCLLHNSSAKRASFAYHKKDA